MKNTLNMNQQKNVFILNFIQSFIVLLIHSKPAIYGFSKPLLLNSGIKEFSIKTKGNSNTGTPF